MANAERTHPEQQHEEKLDRRNALARGAAVAVGAIAATLAPATASAADGDTVRVGTQAEGTSAQPTVWAVNRAGGCAAVAESQSLDGVQGNSKSDEHSGVFASNDGQGWGLYAANQSSTKAAVYGGNIGTAPGVEGRSTHGVGVAGIVDSGGVAVKAQSPTGIAVQAEGSVGIQTEGRATALRVIGKAEFTEAGTGYIERGQSQALVTENISRVRHGSTILVTLNTDPGRGVQLKYARRFTHRAIRVHLTGPAARRTRFSYFIIN